MFVRNPYNYDVDKVSEETGLFCADDSRAIQSQKDDADINVIVKRFGLTGVMPQSVRVPRYEDFDEVFDFQTAQEVLLQARASFMSMPADVRLRFGNDPQAFMEFCTDEKNLDEMRKLGLAVPEPPKPAVPDAGPQG